MVYRRPRRHGRRAAAGGHHERGRRPLRGGRPRAHPAPPRARATCDRRPSLDEALAGPTRPRRGHAAQHRAVGNAADVYPELVPPRRDPRHRHRPDLRARPAERLRAQRHDAGRRARAAARRPRRVRATRRASIAVHVEAMVALQKAGAEVFDYGNNIRGVREGRGLHRRVRVPGLRPRVHPPPLLRGQGSLPLGRALRRPRRHRAHRPRRPRDLPRERHGGALDPHGRRKGPLPGTAQPDLLAGRVIAKIGLSKYFRSDIDDKEEIKFSSAPGNSPYPKVWKDLIEEICESNELKTDEIDYLLLPPLSRKMCEKALELVYEDNYESKFTFLSENLGYLGVNSEIFQLEDALNRGLVSDGSNVLMSGSGLGYTTMMVLYRL